LFVDTKPFTRGKFAAMASWAEVLARKVVEVPDDEADAEQADMP
jgi:hypothetical protein